MNGFIIVISGNIKNNHVDVIDLFDTESYLLLNVYIATAACCTEGQRYPVEGVENATAFDLSC
jgi:hypothetical protein